MNTQTLHSLIAALCAAGAAISCPPVFSQTRTGKLIVVANKGGSAAQPYYEAIDLASDETVSTLR